MKKADNSIQPSAELTAFLDMGYGGLGFGRGGPCVRPD